MQTVTEEGKREGTARQNMRRWSWLSPETAGLSRSFLSDGSIWNWVVLGVHCASCKTGGFEFSAVAALVPRDPKQAASPASSCVGGGDPTRLLLRFSMEIMFALVNRPLFGTDSR